MRQPIGGLLLASALWVSSASYALAQSYSAASCLGAGSNTSSCINSILTTAAAAAGGEVYFPKGTYTLTASLNMQNGVYLRGEGVDATRLDYSGSSVAINGVGTVSQRIIFRISDMTIEAAGAGASADGVWLGQNHRSNPILSRVKIQGFPEYGVYFKQDDWIVSFDHVEISTNGHVATNAAGIFKALAVTDLNAIVFQDSLIEGNGSSSSAAGGVFLMSNSGGPMKGIVFRDCTIEGNFGTDQFLVIYASDLVIDGGYFESDLSQGTALVTVEVDNSTGSINSSRFAVGSGTSQSVAIQLKSSPGMSVNFPVYSGAWGRTLQVQ